MLMIKHSLIVFQIYVKYIKVESYRNIRMPISNFKLWLILDSLDF